MGESFSKLGKTEPMLGNTNSGKDLTTRDNIAEHQERFNLYKWISVENQDVVDRLASIGYVISSSDHVEAIFNGLSEEYDMFVISGNFRSYTIEEIESLLLAQEVRL